MEYTKTEHATYIDEHGGEYSDDGKVFYHYHKTVSDADVYKVCEGCEIIGRQAFNNCSLCEIILPDSVKIIRDQAFFGCSQLKKMNIPRSLVLFEVEHYLLPSSLECIVGESEYYKNLNGMLFNNEISELVLCYSNTSELSIPSSVKSIRSRAFANRTLPEKIILPLGLEQIGDYAFMGCRGLKAIEVPSTVRTLGKGTFWDCHELQDVILPNELSEISKNTFYSCGIENIDLPEGLKIIGEQAFGSNKQLKHLNIPDSVHTIGIAAFENCINLRDIHLPSCLKTIERLTFNGCINLKEINIPPSVRHIKSLAFGRLGELYPLKVQVHKGLSIFISDDAFENDGGIMMIE